MEVKSRHTGEITKIESLENALEALSDVGCCCNGAYLIDETKLGGGAYSVFVYNALIYTPTHEQFIERPSEPKKLEKFLYELFDPYLFKNDNRIRSVIKVHEYKPEEIPQWEREGRDRRLYQLTMLLYIEKKHFQKKEARRKLCSQSDSVDSTGVWEFCLD